MYHSLDESGSVISVRPDVFSWQMRRLAKLGYRGVRFDTLIDAWVKGTPPPERAVVITFDDAYENIAEHAVPVLSELGFSATVFLPADKAGGVNDWPGQDSSIPRLPIMGWNEIGRVADSGFEIAGHTSTHPSLRQLSTDEVKREVVDSKLVIEDRLGRPVRTFAYPFGHWDERSLALVREHYDGACTVELGSADSSDLHKVRRIEMYYLRERPFFRVFQTPLGNAYIGLRAAGRRLKGA
jgi:peptidoglycan/xylan/chitin deacetylase (PgdA/CDA1 family)